MKAQVENTKFTQLQMMLENDGWTCTELESNSDFWTTFETNCPEEEFELFLNELL